MGFGFSNFFETVFDPGDLTGQAAQREADEAAALQREMAQLAITEQRAAREQAREDLGPFREAGAEMLPGLEGLITDPNQQRDFIENNPFFDALASESSRRIMSNHAARGKVGSGGTAEALQNSILLLGNDLLQQNISNRFNVATMGANAAAGQGTATLQTGRTIADLHTQIGNVNAAASIAGHNASTANRSDAAQVVGSIFACDRRIKENIYKVGKLKNGLPVYQFNYIGNDETYTNVMAQDVQKVIPEAVIDIGGVLHVDMEKLHGA